MFGPIAARSAPTSPYGIRVKPGVNGPKPSRYWSSDENPTIVVVRPWKLSSQTMISAFPSGTPRTSYPHFRTILIPVSTASAPVFIGSAASNPDASQSSRRNGPIRSLWKAREVSVRRSSWARAAAMMSGCRWPWFTAE